jgi:hypothetical protein
MNSVQMVREGLASRLWFPARVPVQEKSRRNLRAVRAQPSSIADVLSNVGYSQS